MMKLTRQLADYAALVNAEYKLSDAFIVDLQYGRVTFDDTAG